MEDKKIILTRRNKTVYLENGVIVKEFAAGHPKSAVMKEAFNHALAEESGLPVPKLLGVCEKDGGWCLMIEYIPGRTMAEAMAAEPEKLEEYMEQFVQLQSVVHATTNKQMVRLKDKLNAQISSLREDMEATQRYELHLRLERMKPHTKITHGDFNPTNVILGEDGKVYLIDWAHAAIGNASADAATTYLQFALEDEKKAELYLKLFCRKNDIAKQYVEQWFPIVAAAQLTKKHGAEKEFLSQWAEIAEFE